MTLSPAPWTAGRGHGWTSFIYDADGKVIARIPPRKDAWNGDVLAAAPELLKALEDIMSHVAFTSAWEDAVEGRDDAMLDAGQKAYAIIAKAKGEIS